MNEPMTIEQRVQWLENNAQELRAHIFAGRLLFMSLYLDLSPPQRAAANERFRRLSELSLANALNSAAPGSEAGVAHFQAAQAQLLAELRQALNASG